MTFTYCESVLPCFFDAIWTCLDMFSIHVLTRFRYKWSQMQKVFFTKFFLMFLELLALKKNIFPPKFLTQRVGSFFIFRRCGGYVHKDFRYCSIFIYCLCKKNVLFILWKFYAYIFPKKKLFKIEKEFCEKKFACVL